MTLARRNRWIRRKCEQIKLQLCIWLPNIKCPAGIKLWDMNACQISYAPLHCLHLFHSFTHTALVMFCVCPSVVFGCLGAVRQPAAMTVLSEWSNTPTLWFPQHRAKTDWRPSEADGVLVTTGPFSDSLHYNTFQNMPTALLSLPKAFRLLFSRVNNTSLHSYTTTSPQDPVSVVQKSKFVVTFWCRRDIYLTTLQHIIINNTVCTAIPRGRTSLQTFR